MHRLLSRVVVSLSVLFVSFLPLAAQSVDHQRPPRREALPDGGLAVFDEAGFRVFFDRSTNKLRRYTAEEITRYGLTFDELFNVKGDGLVITERNGVFGIALNEDFLDYTVVRIGADGQLLYACVKGPDAVRRAVSAPDDCTPAAEDK